MRVAVALAREQGAAIPNALWEEIDAKTAMPARKTSQLRALLNRKNERDKRRSHPLLQHDRYGMKDFELAITARRHDLAWAIFYVAESRVQQRILEKLNARARQTEKEMP
jgi:acyl-ACP thioesterase